MATLTAAQLDELATDYSNLAQELLQYKIDNLGTLTALQSHDLGSRIDIVIYDATLLSALATYQTVTDIGPQLDSIKDASANIAAALKTIATVQKVIDIAAIVVKLGSAILTVNVGDIISSVDDLIAALT
jgi:hypothetical protein